MAKFELIVRGGRVIDPASGLDGVHDVAVKDGTIAQVAPRIAGPAARTVDARNQLVIPGMIDTHGHVYQHVTGDFGMNPDEVGVRSGVTAVVDQGGAAPLTIQGFRKFIKDPAATRVYAFVSNYLVGGLLGHRHVGLYGPHGINVKETINAIGKNRDIVKGIKCHAEIGGYSRWGIETLRLAKEASRAAKVPVYVHLGRLWAEENGTTIDPDSVIDDALPLLEPGDILAHPFTKHPGAFVSREGKVHPLIFEAMARGVRIDVGRGGHMSFNAARIALDAGVMPFTIGSDIHGYTIRRRDVWRMCPSSPSTRTTGRCRTAWAYASRPTSVSGPCSRCARAKCIARSRRCSRSRCPRSRDAPGSVRTLGVAAPGRPRYVQTELRAVQ